MFVKLRDFLMFVATGRLDFSRGVLVGTERMAFGLKNLSLAYLIYLLVVGHLSSFVPRVKVSS